MTSLKANGSVTRGYIGIQMQPVTKEIAEAIGLKEPRGALVAEALPNAPAAKAGIRTGDTIVAVDGEPIKEAKDLSRKIADVAPGKSVNVTVFRTARNGRSPSRSRRSRRRRKKASSLGARSEGTAAVSSPAGRSGGGEPESSALWTWLPFPALRAAGDDIGALRSPGMAP